MGSYPDYSPEEYLDGWGWHQDQLVPVPGFGFFPSTMKEELEEEAQVVITVSFINSLLYFLNKSPTLFFSGRQAWSPPDAFERRLVTFPDLFADIKLSYALAEATSMLTVL